MKHLFTTTALLISMTAFAQVGINNTSPKATLDITAKTTDGSKPEGLIIPQLSGNNIRTATTTGIYGTNQKGLIVYASSADSAPTGATANITTAGYYYFDGTNWQKISTGNTVSTSLASGNILVGNASNVATAVSPTGDVTIDNAGVTSIGAGKVTNSQLSAVSTGTGGIYKGSGSLSGNTTVTQGANTLAFTSTTTNGFSVDDTTLSVDAANDRLGIGTAAPQARVHISGVGGAGGDHLRMTNTGSDWALASENAGVQNGIPGKSSFTIVDRANAVRRMTIGSDNSFRLGGDVSAGTAAFSIDGPTNKVGIGINVPNATLDVKAASNGSTPEGIIAPRLSLAALQLYTYTSAQTGAIVYVNSASGTPAGQTANVTAAGYYYFDGTNWQKMTGAVAGDTTNDAWINDTTNGLVKLGTKSDGTARSAGADFVVKDNGQVGIGTNVPSTNLEVNSGTLNDSGLKLTQLTSSTSATSGNVAGIGVDSNGKIVVIGGSTQVNRYTFSSSPNQGSNPSFIPNINSQTINLISGSSRSGNVITLPQGTYEVVFTLGGGFTGESISNYFDARLYLNNSLYQVLASYSSGGTNMGFITGVGVFTLSSSGTIYVGGLTQVGAGAWSFNNSNTSLVIKKLL